MTNFVFWVCLHHTNQDKPGGPAHCAASVRSQYRIMIKWRPIAMLFLGNVYTGPLPNGSRNGTGPKLDLENSRSTRSSFGSLWIRWAVRTHIGIMGEYTPRGYSNPIELVLIRAIEFDWVLFHYWTNRKSTEASRLDWVRFLFDWLCSVYFRGSPENPRNSRTSLQKFHSTQ